MKKTKNKTGLCTSFPINDNESNLYNILKLKIMADKKLSDIKNDISHSYNVWNSLSFSDKLQIDNSLLYAQETVLTCNNLLKHFLN